jgi:hypothetical protein
MKLRFCHENPLIGDVYYYRREGDLEVAVIPLMLGRARISISRVGEIGPDYGY